MSLILTNSSSPVSLVRLDRPDREALQALFHAYTGILSLPGFQALQAQSPPVFGLRIFRGAELAREMGFSQARYQLIQRVRMADVWLLLETLMRFNATGALTREAHEDVMVLGLSVITLKLAVPAPLARLPDPPLHAASKSICSQLEDGILAHGSAWDFVICYSYLKRQKKLPSPWRQAFAEVILLTAPYRLTLQRLSKIGATPVGKESR